MAGNRSPFDKARAIAVTLLSGPGPHTPEQIVEAAEKAASLVVSPDSDFDLDELTSALAHQFSVIVDEATILDDHDPSAHTPWLPQRRGKIDWRFWRRYREFLELDFGMPPPVVNSLDSLTDQILERLEDPTSEGPWDRRGMVVGSVQSGKTANYVGLINKAVDAGYKLIVVLAGIHNNLRAQTQLRLDEGVLGFDTQKNRRLDKDARRIGVSKRSPDDLIIHSLTSSEEKGDFKKTIADQINVMIGGEPVVLVVKKNSRLLGNLTDWVVHVAAKTDSATGKQIIRHPLLLIDDEADNASINTKAKPKKETEDSVTAINGHIRRILSTFERSGYVGYTATPFANIFINPDAETDEHGEDLFPRSFIINVKAPSNYVGPAKVFGLDGDPDAGIEAADPLPIVEAIDDHDQPTRFPPKHKKDHVPTELPPSLRTAIRCFILTCAARRARGQSEEHNSMLVHVSRFVNVQGHVADLIREELIGLQRRIEYGDGDRSPTVRAELRKLWHDEYVPKSARMGIEAGPSVSWQDVDEALHAAASKIEVLPINSFAKEALNYKDHERDGRSVIAVGGDKLSRGLTLEGLSISYFLRTSRMYDTLMQMGRWFGYRPGYLDLCRLFTTKQLTKWYRHIALAETELRREFDYMVAAKQEPQQYGLRVRTHPSGMIVTAINKMSYAQKRLLSWAGVLAQTTRLPADIQRVTANFNSTEKLVSNLGGTPDQVRGSWVWRGVPALQVSKFVVGLNLPPESSRVGGAEIANFIDKQSQKANPELTHWTVALVSVAGGKPYEIGGCKVGLVKRTPEDEEDTRDATFGLRKANILNPADEAIDFDGQPFDRDWFDAIKGKQLLEDDTDWLETKIGELAYEVAKALTQRWLTANPQKILRASSSRPNGRVIRTMRRQRHGLLIIYPLEPTQQMGADPKGKPVIGAALSFPASETAEGVEYQVNRVWQDQIEDDEDFDDSIED